MISLFNTTIKDFPFPLFVTAYAKRHDLSSLKISPRKGVTCLKFISDCLAEYTKFRVSNDYSKESVEKYFCVKLNFIEIKKGKLTATEDLQIGFKVIHVHKK